MVASRHAQIGQRVKVGATLMSVVPLSDAYVDANFKEVQLQRIRPGQKVELKPGGLHIMFLGLHAPLKAGDRFPMKLTFERAGEVTVQVHVDDGSKAADAHQH